MYKFKIIFNDGSIYEVKCDSYHYLDSEDSYDFVVEGEDEDDIICGIPKNSIKLIILESDNVKEIKKAETIIESSSRLQKISE